MNNKINKYIKNKQNTIGEKTYNGYTGITPSLSIIHSMSQSRNNDNANGYSRSKVIL